MPELSFGQIRYNSRERPPWKRGCKLRLEHVMGIDDILSSGSIFTLESMFRNDSGWMVRTREYSDGFLCGRFTLIDDESPRIKTNHKIGAPKGKLP